LTRQKVACICLGSISKNPVSGFFLISPSLSCSQRFIHYCRDSFILRTKKQWVNRSVYLQYPKSQYVQKHPVSIQLVSSYNDKFCERVISKKVGDLRMKRGRPSKLKFSVRQQRLGESLYNVTSQNLRKLTDFILCLRYCMNTLNVNLSRRQPVCVHVWAFKAQWYVYVWPNLNWLHMLYLCISDYCPSKLQLLPLRSSVRNGDEEFTVKYGLRFWNICYNKFLLQYFRPKATFVVTQPPNYKIRQSQYAVKKDQFLQIKEFTSLRLSSSFPRVLPGL
jgi:hypothetical protein